MERARKSLTKWLATLDVRGVAVALLWLTALLGVLPSCQCAEQPGPLSNRLSLPAR